MDAPLSLEKPVFHSLMEVWSMNTVLMRSTLGVQPAPTAMEAIIHGLTVVLETPLEMIAHIPGTTR